VDSSGDEDRSHGDCKAKPDHAKLLLNIFSPKNTIKYFTNKYEHPSPVNPRVG
jgi:hypothetical protein